MSNEGQGSNGRSPLKDIGKAYDSRLPVLDALAEQNVRIHRMTVSRIRSGERSGNEINGWLLAEKKLAEDDASLKNNFYLQIAESGFGQRRSQTARPGVLSSEGLIAAISQDTELTQPSIREALRAMRVDLVFSEHVSAQFPREHFQKVAHDFLDGFGKLPKGVRPPAIAVIGREWTDGTAGSFYQLLYGHMAVRSLAIWTPYEVEVLADFYDQQRQAGNHLTLWDRKVLTAHKEDKTDKSLAEEVRAQTAIGLDRDVVTVHRNALLYGVNARKVALNGHVEGKAAV